MNGRRTFLRQLAGLPLIGGSIALNGQPVATATPVNLALAEAYLGWLRLEQTKLMHEIVDRPMPQWGTEAWTNHAPHCALPECPDLIKVVSAGPAYSRAAVTLSAAGVDLATADTSACRGLADRPRYQASDAFDPVRRGVLWRRGRLARSCFQSALALAHGRPLLNMIKVKGEGADAD